LTPYAVSFLADQPRLIGGVASLRWREWGHAPEPEDLDWWVEATTQESGRNEPPVTFVAHDGREALGAVGLGIFDIEERRDRSPWVLGLIVDPKHRAMGVGSALMERLVQWAGSNGIAEVWAATGYAESFYARCGWTIIERLFCASQGHEVTVLRKATPDSRAG